MLPDGFARTGWVGHGLGSVRIQDCRVHLHMKRFRCNPNYGTSCYTTPGKDAREWQGLAPYEIEGPLGGFDPNRVEGRAYGLGNGIVILPLGPSSAKNPVYSGGVPLTEAVRIHVMTTDAAARIAKAMRHAISLCGGVADPF